jgi:hypothetical protein
MNYGEAVNSLAMRIDGFVGDTPGFGFCVIRIRNAGREPILLPPHWRSMLSISSCRVAGALSKFSEILDHGSGAAVGVDGAQRVPVRLNPGETAGAILNVDIEAPNLFIRVRLERDVGGFPADQWSGTLTSPEFDTGLDWRAASLPCPTFPQALDMGYHYGESQEYYELTTHDGIRISNYRADEARRIYDRAGRRAALEQWLSEETDSARRAYLAGEIAGLGGRVGIRELLKYLGSTEFDVANCARQSLGAAINNYTHESQTPPPALVELALAAIADMRRARDIPARFEFEHPTMQFHARSVIDALVRAKCNRVVPYLIEIVKSRREEITYKAVEQLGQLGDRSAIPALIDYLNVPTDDGKLDTGTVTALVQLGATQIVPQLIECIAYDNNCINALGDLADPRAVEPLEKIVAVGGKLAPNEYEWISAPRLKAAQQALEKIRAAQAEKISHANR